MFEFEKNKNLEALEQCSNSLWSLLKEAQKRLNL